MAKEYKIVNDTVEVTETKELKEVHAKVELERRKAMLEAQLADMKLLLDKF